MTRFQFAAVSSSSGDPTYGNFLDNISFATEPCLNSTTAVAAVNKTTNPGDVLRYSTTVTNVGGDPATGVTLADQLPTNVTYVPGSLMIDKTKSPDPDVSKGTITVGLGPPDGPDGAYALEPGVPTTVTFDVTINSDVPIGDSISNNVSESTIFGPVQKRPRPCRIPSSPPSPSPDPVAEQQGSHTPPRTLGR